MSAALDVSNLSTMCLGKPSHGKGLVAIDPLRSFANDHFAETYASVVARRRG